MYRWIPGVSLSCRFGFTRSGWNLRFCISHKLSYDVKLLLCEPCWDSENRDATGRTNFRISTRQSVQFSPCHTLGSFPGKQTRYFWNKACGAMVYSAGRNMYWCMLWVCYEKSDGDSVCKFTLNWSKHSVGREWCRLKVPRVPSLPHFKTYL